MLWSSTPLPLTSALQRYGLCVLLTGVVPHVTASAWRLPPANLTLVHDAIHVWRASLDVGADRLGVLEPLLASDEHDRAARYRFSHDRRQFIAARGLLRLILSRYLGRGPETIAFQYSAQGKPEVASLQFNVSHAGGLVLYAIARSRRVGIDVEQIRALPDADQLVDRFFSAREVAAYRSLPAGARPEAFVTCWTRKEAFIKALGQGLSHPLDAFDVTVHPDHPPTLLTLRGDPSAAAHWRLQALPIGAGYAATIAAESPPWQLACLDASTLVSRHCPAATPSRF